MFLFAIAFITYYIKKFFVTEPEIHNNMENEALNGETNQTNDHEIHVTQAEVNHESLEPTALKRNVVANNDSEENDEPKLTNGHDVEQSKNNEQESSEPVAESEGDKHIAAPEQEDSIPENSHTSETFMKIEEKKVIERLSKVIDAELTLQLADVNNGKESEKEQDETKDETSLVQTEVKDENLNEDSHELKQETEEVKQSGEDVEAQPHESITFSAVEENSDQNEENKESEEATDQDDLKSNDSIIEPQENNADNEVRFHAVQESYVATDNHIEDSQKSSVPEEEEQEEERSEVREPEVVGVVKQNGNRYDENQNEDDVEEEEEEDDFQESKVFKSTLKMWSTGKSSQSPEPPINSRDKFKTLRQIKKGNTRSLMEKFQIPK